MRVAVPGQTQAAKDRRRAWTMVWLAMLGTMCCSTSVVLINVGIFMKPLADHFGWTRGSIALSLSIAALTMAAVNPLAGRLIDKYGVRPVLIGSLFFYGIATALIPSLVGKADIWGLYIGYAVVAGLGAGSNVIAYVRLLSGWFAGDLNRSRGLALGISSAGIPLGAAVTGPLAVLMIEAHGWAAGYWALSFLPLLIGLPLAIFWLRSAPSEMAVNEATGTSEQASGMTFAEAARTRPFWILIGIVLLMSSCLQGMTIHTAPLLSDLGITPDGLALITAIDGAAGIIGRIVAGHIFDRIFAPRAAIVIYAVASLSALLVAGAPVLWVAIFATLLISFGSGAESDLVGYVVGRYFGLRSYGQIFGTIYGMFMVGIAVGPYLFGVGFDISGSYSVSFVIGAIGLALLCGLLAMLPAFPDQQNEETEMPKEAPPIGLAAQPAE